MTCRAIKLLLLLAVACGGGFRVREAAAQAAPRSDLPAAITLEQALELSHDRSPGALAEKARIDIAESEQIAAGVRPNPSFNYGGLVLAQGANTGAEWVHQVAVEQPLLLFGQIGARKDVAGLGVRAERARVSSRLADRALTVRQSFATLVANQQRTDVLSESLADMARIEHIVRGRQQAGDRSRYDLARVELETTTLRVELDNARTDVEDASGQLASLLGFPGWKPRAVGDLEPVAIPTELDLLWRSAEARRPSIVAARAEESVARSGITLAQRERMPVPQVALGTAITEREDSTSVLFGVSVPLPTFDRGQGALARAAAELRAASQVVVAEVAETRARLEQATAVYQRQTETLRSIEQNMLQRIPALRTMADESYRGGSTGVLELLDAFRSIKEIRLMHLAQREVVKLAEATVIAVAALESPGAGKEVQ